MFILLNFPLELKNVVGVFAQSQGQMSASGSLSEPESTLEAPTSKDAFGVIVMDLDAGGGKFAANL